MQQSPKDLFSSHADIYARYRPRYPQQLYDFILAHVPKKNTALDCGTGNGQCAAVLADHFKEVNATDISEKQIVNAPGKSNLYYHVCAAEKLPFQDNYFDLVTCATAVHWFRLDDFFSEVKRVAKQGAIFACWAYNVFRTDQPALNEMIDDFYWKKIYEYWDPERRHVDAEYKTISFPFEEIPNPGFAAHLVWDWQHFEGYLNTWSAVQHYIRRNNLNPVSEFMQKIRTEFDRDIPLKMTFPIFMRIGIVKK
jgi:ubiquinone/menaquinone biosynthesis C-methylase UbiE